MPVDIKSIVSVDSMPLVWCLRTQGPAEQCARAQWLFDQFTKRKTQIILSTVVLAEYLTLVDKANHPNVIAELKNRFLVLPFDERCASTAAALFKMGQQMR